MIHGAKRKEKKVEICSMLRISILRKMTKVRIGQKCDTEEEERREEDKPIYIVGLVDQLKTEEKIK